MKATPGVYEVSQGLKKNKKVFSDYKYWVCAQSHAKQEGLATAIDALLEEGHTAARARALVERC